MSFPEETFYICGRTFVATHNDLEQFLAASDSLAIRRSCHVDPALAWTRLGRFYLVFEFLEATLCGPPQVQRTLRLGLHGLSKILRTAIELLTLFEIDQIT
jgi:hypothetical protein